MGAELDGAKLSVIRGYFALPIDTSYMKTKHERY